jgi:pyruvate formate lyase activating enzyme
LHVLNEATVFDVQRFSIHDGPGIRTVVFFKGCSLQCQWCQNPEGIRAEPELAVYTSRCLGAAACGACVAECPRHAIAVIETVSVDRSLCDGCGACPAVCPAEALRMVGRRWSIESLVEACLRDRAYAEASGGGVTFSGGEPVLHSEFLRRLLPVLRSHGMHLLLQTAGNYSWRRLAPLLPLLDAIYFDWKVPFCDYPEYTGHDATRISENLRRLVREGMRVTVRMPLVAGVNTTTEQVADIAKTLTALGVHELTLLQYHGLWEAKLPALDTHQLPMGAQAPVDTPRVAGDFTAGGITVR